MNKPLLRLSLTFGLSLLDAQVPAVAQAPDSVARYSLRLQQEAAQRSNSQAMVRDKKWATKELN